MTSSLEAAAGLCRSRDQRKGARGGDREGAVDARDGAEPNERRAGPYGHRSHRRRDFPRRRTAVNDGRAEEREGRGTGGEEAHQDHYGGVGMSGRGRTAMETCRTHRRPELGKMARFGRLTTGGAGARRTTAAGAGARDGGGRGGGRSVAAAENFGRASPAGAGSWRSSISAK